MGTRVDVSLKQMLNKKGINKRLNFNGVREITDHLACP